MFLSQNINTTAAGRCLLEIGFAHNIQLTSHVMQVRILFPACGALRPAKSRVNTQRELIRVSEMPELVSWAGFGEKQVPPQEESADLRCSSKGEMNCCIAEILIWKPQINSNSQQPPGVQLRSGFFENRNRGKRKLSCLSRTSHESPAATADLTSLGSPLQWCEHSLDRNPPLWKHKGRQLNECLQIGEAPQDGIRDSLGSLCPISGDLGGEGGPAVQLETVLGLHRKRLICHYRKGFSTALTG